MNDWTNNVTWLFLDRFAALGREHSLLLKEDGSVWATGLNKYGQLGDGTTTNRWGFIQVIAKEAVVITAGKYHGMVLKKDGSVWSTGWNENGQLGDGTTTSKNSFVQVIEKEARAIAAGIRHSMVLKEDGSVWATGSNTSGRLGERQWCTWYCTRDRTSYARITGSCSLLHPYRLTASYSIPLVLHQQILRQQISRSRYFLNMHACHFWSRLHLTADEWSLTQPRWYSFGNHLDDDFYYHNLHWQCFVPPSLASVHRPHR